MGLFLNNNYLLLKANRPLSHCSHEGHVTLGAEAHNFTWGQLARLVARLSFHGSARRHPEGVKILISAVTPVLIKQISAHGSDHSAIKFFNFSIYIISKIFVKIKFMFYTGSFIFLVISILAIVSPNENVIIFFFLTTAFGKLFTRVSAIIH